MSSTKGPYPFNEKEIKYRGFSDAALRWSVQDAQSAAMAMRGFDPVAEAWYLDDVHTILAEINHRTVSCSSCDAKGPTLNGMCCDCSKMQESKNA